MKKILVSVLVLLMAAMLLTGCGAKGGKEAETEREGQEEIIDSLKTIGDVIALNKESEQYAFYSDAAVYAFGIDGRYYRVSAQMPEDVSEAVWALDYDEQYEDRVAELVGPLPIDSVEELTDQMLTKEEMAALVGKTGKDLLDAGWYNDSGYSLETMEFWMAYGPFEYTVTFDGKVPEAQWDTFDADEGIRDLKVRSVEFLMLGDATNIE